MKFDAVYYINSGRRSGERLLLNASLRKARITAVRVPGVDVELSRPPFWGGDPECCGIEASTWPGLALSYSRNLSLAILVKEALRLALPSILVFADDVIFHSNYPELLESVDEPDDWDLFYLGFSYLADPDPVSGNLVKTHAGIPPLAVGIKNVAFKRLLKLLCEERRLMRKELRAVEPLSTNREIFRSYSVFPSIVWQPLLFLGATKEQRITVRDQVLQDEAVLQSTLLKLSHLPENFWASPKLGLLFLTREDVNQPRIWEEFRECAGDSLRVFSHSKFNCFRRDAFLHGTSIPSKTSTAWGGISLVKATLLLLKAALEDPSLTHFALLSESCVPIRPFSSIAKILRVNPKSRFKTVESHVGQPIQISRADAMPEVSTESWRFQSQWWLMDRVTAEWCCSEDYTAAFSKIEIPDEVYFSTVLSSMGYPLESMVQPQASTWTFWEEGCGSPRKFEQIPNFIKVSLAESSCFFARKFAKTSDIGDLRLHI